MSTEAFMQKYFLQNLSIAVVPCTNVTLSISRILIQYFSVHTLTLDYNRHIKIAEIFIHVQTAKNENDNVTGSYRNMCWGWT